MTASDLRKSWIGKTFRGEIPALPPVLPTSEATGARVREARGTFSVVPADQIPDGVRVLRIDGRKPGEAGYPLRE